MFDNNNSRRPGGFRSNQDGASQRPRFTQSSRPGRETGNSRPRFVRNAGEGDERPRRPRFQSGERVAFGEQRERVMRPRRNAPKPVSPENKRQKYHEKYEDPTKPIRLNKYLANAGICSRREADDFIQAGVITVNGEVVSSLGTKVMPTDKVMFHNQPVHRERKIYILLNKPKNTVTTTDDPQERRTVIDIVRNACAERIYPVGRLDRNTTGVLLLTNDGDLASKLTHPKFGKKKIYAATLDHEAQRGGRGNSEKWYHTGR